MKKKISFILAACMLATTVTGCGANDNNKDKVNNEVKEDTTQTSAETSKEYQLYTDLFDLNNMISIQIDISQEEIDKIQEDYEYYDSIDSKSPIYRKAEKVYITVGDEVYEIEEVGIRLKGNTSRVPVYDEETGELNLSHYKLSFNETFDDEEYYGEDAKVWDTEEERQERKDRRFATLKSLEVKWNKNYDDTYVREIYANEIFREAGILAQRVNLCSFGLNGENYGVVNIYEPVDSIFIEKNIPEEDWGGDLYKCGWTNRPANYMSSIVTYGIEDKDSAEIYNYDLKTNKKDATFESIENFLDELNESDITKEKFEEIVDMDYFIKFLAVSYFVGNPDDMRYNYNNHYIYFLKSSGKAIFIPYDNDRCLGITYGWNPDGSGMTESEPFSDEIAGGWMSQTNPLITKTILNGGLYVDEYKTALEEVAASEFWNTEKFEEYYEKALANYESVVTPSIEFANSKQEFKFSLEGEFTTADECNMSFEEYVTRKMETYKGA